MTKKYTVASSRIVCKIPGRPFGSDNAVPNNDPVPKLMKTITGKAMASKSKIHVEQGKLEDRCGELPKNKDSDMYANSKRGDLVNTHKWYAGRGICGISQAKESQTLVLVTIAQLTTYMVFGW